MIETFCQGLVLREKKYVKSIDMCYVRKKRLMQSSLFSLMTYTLTVQIYQKTVLLQPYSLSLVKFKPLTDCSCLDNTVLLTTKCS